MNPFIGSMIERNKLKYTRKTVIVKLRLDCPRDWFQLGLVGTNS